MLLKYFYLYCYWKAENSEVSRSNMLTSRSKICWFKPDWDRWIFTRPKSLVCNSSGTCGSRFYILFSDPLRISILPYRPLSSFSRRIHVLEYCTLLFFYTDQTKEDRWGRSLHTPACRRLPSFCYPFLDLKSIAEI